MIGDDDGSAVAMAQLDVTPASRHYLELRTSEGSEHLSRRVRAHVRSHGDVDGNDDRRFADNDVLILEVQRQRLG